MMEQIVFEGRQVSARDLVAASTRTSWPDVYSTPVAGVLLRWQYANKGGPCAKETADRIVVPFAHAGIPKGTELRLVAPARD